MRVGVCVIAALVVLAVCGTAQAATTSQNIRFTASDGVSLQTTISGQAPLAPRPTIVEFSPYGRNSGTFTPAPDYNFLLVQTRGTGDSDVITSAILTAIGSCSVVASTTLTRARAGHSASPASSDLWPRVE